MLKLPDTETSYWREAYSQSVYPALGEDLDVDVAIIGAGITGLSSAYFLKQAGYTVAVIEKDTIGGGTTGRTTGKVTSQHNLIYVDLQQRLGTSVAQAYGEANQVAVEQVSRIIKQERIDCDWERADNYVYTTNSAKVDQFNYEAKTAVRLGLPASFAHTTPLPFKVQAAVKFSRQGKLHAQKYLLGLAQAVQGNGSCIFEHSNATGIRDGKPGRVTTKKAAVTAKHIIVATSVPTLPLAARGGYCLMEYPKQSYIVMGKLPKALPGMYISPDRHQYSILPIDDSGEQRILIGGESNISGLSGNKLARYQRLADYAERHFGVREITHRWADRDYLSYDGVPLIGKLYPWSQNLYVATAYGKWGLSNGTAAGMILRDLISGAENKWASSFTSNRTKPIASIPRAAAKYLRIT